MIKTKRMKKFSSEELTGIQKTFSKINSIFLTLVAVMVLFLLFTIYLVSKVPMQDAFTTEMQITFKILMAVYTVLVLISGMLTYKRRVKSIPRSILLVEKVEYYRKTVTIKLIGTGGAILFTFAVLLLTSDFLILVLSGLLFVILFIQIPGKKQFSKDFDLTEEEDEALNQTV